VNQANRQRFLALSQHHTYVMAAAVSSRPISTTNSSPQTKMSSSSPKDSKKSLPVTKSEGKHIAALITSPLCTPS
jgi:hypothetical protein